MTKMRKLHESALCPPACNQCQMRASNAFSPVTHKQLVFIEKFRSGVTGFIPGSTVIAEATKTHPLYTLYSGWAFRFKTLADGRRQILNFLLPGDFIGLQEQFGEHASHGVEALSDVTLCQFNRSKLWDLFREQPELAYTLTWLNAREEMFVDNNLLTTGRRNARERIAMLLLHLHRRVCALGLNSGNVIDFPLTQEHIADALGLSLVHTNKSLRQLHRAGLHVISDGKLVLLNPKALENLADYYDRPTRVNPLI